MYGYFLRLLGPIASAVTGLSLLGCATSGSYSQPAVLGMDESASLSLKDVWAPTVTRSEDKIGPKVAGFTSPRAVGRPSARAKAGLASELPTCGDRDQCMVLLKAMIDDPKRSWVGQQQSAVAYANGTRLFAYHALRHRFSCSELTLALHEIGAASKTFGEPVRGVKAEHASLLLVLNAQVEGELRVEHATRCKT